MEKSDIENEDNDLDPRIQVELEQLNTATDEINKLEIELDEATTTFRMLLNESTRRLKLLGKKLGSCIEKARPYYKALDDAKNAQLECQKAAVQYQRANEFLTAAKEMVALAERRFENGECNFDGAWQDMLNHATSKVIQAESERSRLGCEHHAKAQLFHAAEQKFQQLEDDLRRHIIKSRPYFEEKNLCQEQLNTQKQRIESLQSQVTHTKFTYSESLKKLELISEEIHLKRKRNQSEAEYLPQGPREPGVGAELNSPTDENKSITDLNYNFEVMSDMSNLPSCSVSEKDENEDENVLIFDENNDIRPVEGCSDDNWDSELKTTVEKLDHMNLMNECVQIEKKHGQNIYSNNCDRRTD